MSKFGTTLFGGGRCMFWLIAPAVLATAALVSSNIQGSWMNARGLITAGLDVMAVSFTLALWNPIRFRWAARVVTGLVFVSFLAYFVSELFGGSGPRSGGRQSPMQAFFGLLIIGLPCLWYTWTGGWTDAPDDDAEEPADD